MTISIASVLHPKEGQADRDRFLFRIVLLIGLVMLALVMLGAAIRLVHTVDMVERLGKISDINDFDRWMKRIPHHIREHADLVDEKSANTVLDMWLLSPLTHLSRAGSQVAWVLCKGPMVVAIVWFLLAMVKRARRRIGPGVLLLIFLAWGWPVVGDIQEGQTNLLMLLPLVAGLWAAQQEDRKGFTWLGGILIALAVAIKVTPLIFLPYALWRRRWKLALAICLGIALWFVVVPGLALGWHQNIAWQQQWIHVMLFPYARGEVPVVMGESLPSFLTKLLRHVPAFVSEKTGTSVAHYMNIADLSAPAVGWIVRGILGAIGLAGLWWMRKPLRSLANSRFLIEAGCIGAFMLWASQWTLVAHYVTLILPLAATAMVADDKRNSARVRSLALGALTAAVLLMFLTSDVAKWIAGPDGREYMMAINVCLMASMTLAGILFYAGEAHSPETEPSTTP